MTELVSLNDEKQKRVPECMFCGKREHHPAYSCPRIASLTLDDGQVWQVEFHDWEVAEKGE